MFNDRKGVPGPAKAAVAIVLATALAAIENMC